MAYTVHVYGPVVSSCHFYLLRTTGQNIRYAGVNCVLGLPKSIRYSGDFIIAGFVSTYFTVILLGFLFLVNVNWVFVYIAEFVIAGCH